MSNFRWLKGGGLNNESGYLISFDYDADIVNKPKETIPSHLREWNPEKEQWWVSILCETQINDIFPGFLEATKAQRALF